MGVSQRAAREGTGDGSKGLFEHVELSSEIGVKVKVGVLDSKSMVLQVLVELSKGRVVMSEDSREIGNLGWRFDNLFGDPWNQNATSSPHRPPSPSD